MDAVRVELAFGWAALLFTYLLGDVLRIFAGDFTPGEIDGQPATPAMWLAAAGFMLVPIVMMLLSLVVPPTPLLWLTIGLTAGLVVLNAIALPYPGLYDNALIVVGFAINGFVVWRALVGLA